MIAIILYALGVMVMRDLHTVIQSTLIMRGVIAEFDETSITVRSILWPFFAAVALYHYARIAMRRGSL